jgi:hypothetical protein
VKAGSLIAVFYGLLSSLGVRTDEGGIAMGKSNKCSCRNDGGCECGEGCGCECCCCGSSEGGFKRRYQTKAEQVAELEQYLKDLKDEVQAVEERLADLRRRK